jgi:hypothetical protein
MNKRLNLLNVEKTITDCFSNSRRPYNPEKLRPEKTSLLSGSSSAVSADASVSSGLKKLTDK